MNIQYCTWQLFVYPPPEYFSPHLGEYLNVLSALEKLNVAILKAMDKTKEVCGQYSMFKRIVPWNDIFRYVFPYLENSLCTKCDWDPHFAFVKLATANKR